MSVFTDNIKNDLPTKVRVEQKIYMAIRVIEDRDNNDFGSCRLVFNTVTHSVEPISGSIDRQSTVSTFLNEVHNDIIDKKLNLEPATGIALGDLKWAAVQPDDPEKCGYNVDFSVVHYEKKNKRKTCISY